MAVQGIIEPLTQYISNRFGYQMATEGHQGAFCKFDIVFLKPKKYQLIKFH
jgi:hypothetical protein